MQNTVLASRSSGVRLSISGLYSHKTHSSYKMQSTQGSTFTKAARTHKLSPDWTLLLPDRTLALGLTPPGHTDRKRYCMFRFLTSCSVNTSKTLRTIRFTSAAQISRTAIAVRGHVTQRYVVGLLYAPHTLRSFLTRQVRTSLLCHGSAHPGSGPHLCTNCWYAILVV